MSDDLFDEQSIDIPCPQCGHETKETIRWLRANADYVCAGCGRDIHLERDKLLRGLEDAQNQIADLVGRATRKFR